MPVKMEHDRIADVGELRLNARLFRKRLFRHERQKHAADFPDHHSKWLKLREIGDMPDFDFSRKNT
jgi:hypothetical protein